MSYYKNIVVVVCGGRDFKDKYIVYETLNKIHKRYTIEYLASGGAGGVDSLAEQWAKDNKISRTILEADWKRYGNKAGPIRNQKLLDFIKPDIVVAFPGNTGTRDMLNKSKKTNAAVMEVFEDGTFEFSYDD